LVGVARLGFCLLLTLLDRSSSIKFNGTTGSRAADSGYLELDNPVLAEINRSTSFFVFEKTTVVLFETHLCKELDK
jgi:hypothetical protein